MPVDAFYTPIELALALVRCLPIRPGDVVMEPSVGGGAWLQAVRQVHPRPRRHCPARRRAVADCRP